MTLDDAPGSRSFGRAMTDVREGLHMRQLWAHLGWQDIKQRYRRSVLGPFWITISQAVIALGLGILYAALFHTHFETFLPYIVTGFIVWNFISGCLLEGMETFISNEGLIKHLPAPLSVYSLRTVWRQTLLFLHTMIVYVVILVIFFTSLDHPYSLASPDGTCNNLNGALCHPGIGWTWLLAIPGFMLLAANAVWASLLLGIVSTRFRDLPQLIGALVQLMFYMTPIVWPIDQLTQTTGSRHNLAGVILPILKLNPLYHFVQVVRGPLLGQSVSWTSWLAVGLMTVVGWALAFVALRNYRARVSYWV
ncbi:MAG TPA: ABC transporter permease [Pseudonocardiaceae bacterium]|jgi:ABC-2 type transport system permease protein|nr:ABC transporter permease [Pseudonocardiaceae bacterium]